MFDALDLAEHFFELVDALGRFCLVFEMCSNHCQRSTRNNRICNIRDEHHSPATANFAHDLLTEDKLGAFALPFFEFRDPVLLVQIPVMTLLDESDHARVAQRETTEYRRTV